MARELLRYRPVDDLYEDRLDRITELVSATRLACPVSLTTSPSSSRG